MKVKKKSVLTKLEELISDELSRFRMKKLSYGDEFEKYFSKDYVTGYLNSLIDTCDKIRISQIEDCFKIYFAKSSKEKVKDYVDKKGESFACISMLTYRGKTIPVYVDWQGQQNFIVYKDTPFGGGAFNTFPELSFMRHIDDVDVQTLLNYLYEK